MIDELRELFLEALKFNDDDALPLVNRWNEAVRRVQESFDNMTREVTMAETIGDHEQKYGNRKLLEELAYYAAYPPKGYIRKTDTELIQWIMFKSYQIIKRLGNFCS